MLYKYKIILYVLCISSLLFGEVTISGSIKSDEGKILLGANIVLKGSSHGSVSDQKGQFILGIQVLD